TQHEEDHHRLVGKAWEEECGLCELAFPRDRKVLVVREMLKPGVTYKDDKGCKKPHPIQPSEVLGFFGRCFGRSLHSRCYCWGRLRSSPALPPPRIPKPRVIFGWNEERVITEKCQEAEVQSVDLVSSGLRRPISPQRAGELLSP